MTNVLITGSTITLTLDESDPILSALNVDGEKRERRTEHLERILKKVMAGLSFCDFGSQDSLDHIDNPVEAKKRGAERNHIRIT